ncbi:MAG: D-cysteine desulfhydrase family protein [Asgard group archaeon]|nr:D-cysteine desulfhydrase family protein [Asgard group archaeon]
MEKFDIDSISRLNHCLLPTPIVPMERLTEYCGKANIFIKRDDLTGIAFGGNKNRKLEFLMADALLKGSDVIITEGALTSNHCLQTAAFAARVGLDCILVLSDAFIGEQITGNLLLNQILDTKIYRVATSAERKPAMEKIAQELIYEGKAPYIIPTGGSNTIGILGYILFMREIAEQSVAMNIQFDYLIHGSGSAGTQAGILVGKKLYYPEIEIIGISAGDKKDEIVNDIKQITTDFIKEWSLDFKIANDEIIVLDDYFGDGYGAPSEEMIETVKLVAKLEGIFLDPVYNGKAMIGLIDLINRDIISSDANILFLHSGGGPALFSYSSSFSKKI